MRFTKMHGAGNDYIYVDCFAQPIPENIPELARKISDRRFGVGADGLILICPTEHADAEMRMFNADGSYSEMCGNGIRCVAKYVYDHGIKRSNQLRIATAERVLALEVEPVDGLVERVRVDMGEPILLPSQIPTTLRSAGGSEDPVVDVPLNVGGREFLVSCVSMGNPHCVVFVEEATDEWVLGTGPKVENDSHFPKRVNVEFVEVLARNELRQRTWERGSGETFACGTGACAVTVAGVLSGRTDRKLTIHLRGGDLSIDWSEGDNHVYKTGPAAEIFSGEWRV
ncbi:MAG TPA: diaminopimelate epimerase [Lacipirellulaceae bacterium]|jgi:diaminopimelate epimerase|nr:diaminopimelate epimerase [Lacipirellulaceae bacterium]